MRPIPNRPLGTFFTQTAFLNPFIAAPEIFAPRWRRQCRTILAILMILTGSILHASAATYIWQGGSGNSDWFDHSNWDQFAVPGAGDNVLFEEGLNLVVDWPPNMINLNRMEVRGDVTFRNASASFPQEIVVNELVVSGEGQLSLACEVVHGQVQLTSSRSLDLSSRLVVGNRCVLNLPGSAVLSSAGRLEIQALGEVRIPNSFFTIFDNRGQVEQRGGLTTSPGSYALNRGLWKVYSRPLGSVAGQGIIRNEGTMQTFGAPSIVNMRLEDSGGLLQVQSGSIQCPGGTTYRPIILNSPQSQTVAAGQTVTFTVNAALAQEYSWIRGSSTLPNASGPTLQLSNVSAADAGTYYVVAARPEPSGMFAASSDLFTLTVTSAVPVITIQPANQSVFSGQTATFSVGATGPNLSYQWRKAGLNIPGAASSTLLLSGVSAASADSYSVLISNSYGSVTSASALLTVIPTATITMQPASQSVFENQGVTFTVAAAGNNLSYQWYKDGQSIAGATSPSYTIAQVPVYGAGDYTVAVTNPSGVTFSNPARLTLLAPSYLQTIADSLAASIGSRALQSSVTAVQSSVNAIGDTNISSRTSQTSVNDANTALSVADGKINGLASAVSNLATQASVASLQTNVNGRISTAQSSLDLLQSSAAQLNSKLDGLAAPAPAQSPSLLTNLDALVSSRVSEASLEALRTNTLAALASNALSRASQASVDSANSALSNANAKLDGFASSISSAATLASVSELQTNLAWKIHIAQGGIDLLQTTAGTLSGKLDGLQTLIQTNGMPALARLDATISSRASEASIEDLRTNTLETLNSNTLSRASQASVDNASAGVTAANGKLDILTSNVGTLAKQDSLAALHANLAGRFTNTQSTLDSLQASAALLDAKLSALPITSQANLALATVNLDTTISSRASQSSIEELRTNTLSSLNSNVLSRASQASLDSANSALAAATGKLDSLTGTAATLATQSALTGFQSVINGKLTTAQSSLDSLQSSSTIINTKLDTLGAANQSNLASATSNLDATVSSRSSQASLDDFRTNTIALLSSNVLLRATQASVDAANSILAAANGKLDVASSTRASQASLDAANTALAAAKSSLGVVDDKLNSRLDAATSSRATQLSVDTANSKLNLGLDTNVLSRASQASMNTANASLTAATTSLGVLDGKLNARLDAAMTSRATQASLDAVRTNVDSGFDLVSRLAIERQLADATSPRLAMFFVPAANGGLLEFVRDIVADTVLISQNAGIAVGKASTFLASGNTALANRQYKSAYDNYAAAYQAVVK